MRLYVAVVCAALSLSSLAYAQSKPAIPPADDVEAAKAHFAAGSAYYDQANYADAVKEFNEAYRLSHRSDLLYNIAVCYERLQQYDNAIKALQQYLIDKPEAKDKVTIQTRISNLEKQRDAMPPRPVEPPPQPVAPPPQPQVAPQQPAQPMQLERKRNWWVPGTIVGSAGLVVLATALGTGLTAQAYYDDLKMKCQNNVCTDPKLATERDTGQVLALTTDILLGVGAAATLTGVIILAVQSRRPHPPSQARVVPTPFGVMGRF
jgi:tetratricopeptide (TPR) repeat protein